MKKNEWKQSAKEAKQRSIIEPNRRCKNCGEPLDFGDVRCPNCGADAHVRRVPYVDELRSDEIQPRPRVHEGTGPETADIDVGWGMLSKLDVIMPLFSIAAGIVMIFAVDADKPTIFKISVGLLTAVGLWLLSMLLIMIAKNLATAAQNSEKEVGNTAFIIRRLNEFLDKYDESNDINDQNAEEFAKMTSRLIRLNEQQAGRGKCRHRHAAPAEDAVPAEEAPEEEQPEVEAPAEEPEVTEAAEPVAEEPAQEAEEAAEEKPAEEPEKEEQPEKKEEEKPGRKNGIKKKAIDFFEDEPEEEKPAEPEEAEPEQTESAESGEEEQEEFEDAILPITCPHCDAPLERKVSQLAGGTVACDVCGGMFHVELEEEEMDDDWVSDSDYNDDGFFDGKGDILDK